MMAATIGFIGVIAGSLITAWFNRSSEKEKRRDEAALAAQLISGELESAARRLGSYARTSRWGVTPITTVEWIKHGTSLAAELDEKDHESLRRAYSLAEARERERTKYESENIGEGRVKKLKEECVVLTHISDSVKESIPEPFSARFSGLSSGLGHAALGAVGIVLLIAAFVPRADMSNASIAAALADELHGEEYVACSQTSDHWHCEATYPPRVCQIKRPAEHRAALTAGAVRVESGGRSCGAGSGPRSPPKDFDVSEGPDALVALERPDPTLPDDLFEDEDLAALRLEVGDSSAVDQAVEELFGGN